MFLILLATIVSCGGKKTFKDDTSAPPPVISPDYQEMTPSPDTYEYEEDYWAGMPPPAPSSWEEETKQLDRINLRTIQIEGSSPAAAGEDFSHRDAAWVLQSQLTSGAIAYEVPDTIKMGKEYQVKLRIDNKISEALTEGLGEKYTLKIIDVSQTMKAELSGDGFRIDTTYSSSTQLRKFDKPTVWKWGITPVSGGTNILKMKIVCILKREGFSDETYDIVTYTDTIKVAVNPTFIAGRFWENNWKTIIGFIISSGVMTWIIGFILKKKKGPVA